MSRINVESLVGKVFPGTMLTILEVSAPVGESARRFVLCRCKCGVEKSVRLDGLQAGTVKSCGCFQKAMGHVQGLKNTKHGHCRRLVDRDPVHNIWKQMNQRCINGHKNYGARGIKVCERWKGKRGFQNFIDDMGPRPSSRHSIDRFPDQNGDYEPGNCRWATPKEQGRNRRDNLMITFDGKNKPLSEWSEIKNISYTMLYSRLRHGWSIEEAFSIPVGQKRARR
jgi:hypothetical protein